MEKLLESVPGQLEIRSGGGFMSVFGVPFLAAGIFLALIGFRVIALTNADEIPEWGWLAMVLMALAFVVVGGGLVFGRRWKTIDRSRGMITVGWGLLVPMKSSEHGLDEYSAVVLSHVAGDSDSSERFPVGLRGKAPKTILPLTSPASYAVAREQAERIARTLGFPLIDRSTGHETVAEIQAPGHPLRDRFQNASAVRESVTAPPLMRSIVQRSPDATTITIPGPGFRLGAALQFAIPLGFALFVLLNIVPFFDRTNIPPPGQLMFLGFALLFLFIPLASALYTFFDARARATVVSASARGITIEERHLWRSRTAEIGAETILDIDLCTTEDTLGRVRSLASRLKKSDPGGGGWSGGQMVDIPPWALKLRRLLPSNGITVKAKTGLFAFGAGLADDEVRYLHSVVKNALAAGSNTDIPSVP